MRRELPEYYADILAKSSGNQIQLVYTSQLPAYGKGRICLIGDAGMMVQPMTGSGVFKGYANSRDLLVTLHANEDVLSAVSLWSDTQVRICQRMLDMGHQMEQAFIWNTPDLAAMSRGDARQWFDAAITIPDDFSYFAAPAAA